MIDPKTQPLSSYFLPLITKTYESAGVSPTGVSPLGASPTRRFRFTAGGSFLFFHLIAPAPKNNSATIIVFETKNELTETKNLLHQLRTFLGNLSHQYLWTSSLQHRRQTLPRQSLPRFVREKINTEKMTNIKIAGGSKVRVKKYSCGYIVAI